ncbi:MAG: 3-isopropylmalate dehydrogenase [Chloroflexi bacterium]|nr:3-isopropylmalate dehydrogenase [Chloroflexota bacterium]
MEYALAVLPGDGVGPEVTAEAVRVLEAVGQRFGHQFSFTSALVGGIAIDQTGDPLPPETLALARASDAVLFGAVGGPKWDDPRAKTRPEAGLLAIRRGLGLFANLRPVSAHPDLIDASPIARRLVEGVDLVVVRELTGGLYFAAPKRRWTTTRGRRAVDTLKYTEQEIRRVLNVGFELARGRRKKLTSVDKANVLESSRLWREVAQEMAADNPDVEVRHMLVDACAMHLIQRPRDFDVIVTENMFGDILTDEASVLAGSMGMLPSASLGTRRVKKPQGRFFGLYEPIHGSAPDIAGRGVANPVAAILSGAMLLRLSLGLEAEADAVEAAVSAAISAGYRTADIDAEDASAQREPCRVGSVGMADAVIERVSNPEKMRVPRPL